MTPPANLADLLGPPWEVVVRVTVVPETPKRRARCWRWCRVVSGMGRRLVLHDAFCPCPAPLRLDPQQFSSRLYRLPCVPGVIVLAEQVKGVYRLPALIATQRVGCVMNPA